ncbi:MAG: DUF445 family protein [Halanaerobium sp.]
MVLDLLAIISAAGTGAVTGYLTNNLALKMIFKEYGPLGGVVIKTKDEFIESISALVERDLINHHTLEEEFSRPEFKENFARSLSDFLNIYLDQRTKGIILNELPAWEENYGLLASLLGNSSVNLLQKSTEHLADEKLEQIISQSELQKLLQEVYLKLIDQAEKKGSLENISLGLYQKLKSKKLEQLLSSELQSELKNFIKEVISFFAENYQNLNQKKKSEFKEKIKELFNLESLAGSLLEELKEIKISDLFKTAAELEELKQNKILQQTLSEILLNLKIEIANSDFKVEDLLTEQLEENIQKDLAEVISNSETSILELLETEEEDLNSLILEAVEAEIEASTGFKAMSRQGIYSKYQENIADYGLPVTHLKESLSEKLNSESQELAEALLAKIKDFKLKKLLAGFDFKAQAGELENIIWNFYQENREKQLFELFSEEVFQQQLLEEKIIELIFSLIKKLSSTEESVDLVTDYLAEFELQDLINEQSLLNKSREISDEIYQQLGQSDFLAAKLSQYLNNQFFALFNAELTTNQAQFKQGAENYFKDLKKNFADRELKEFYQLIKGEETVVKLTDSITTFFYNNLPELIEGRVAQAAAANLHQLSDQEVQQAIEDFMGKELKPITYLGALLGAAAGIIFSLSGAEAAVFNSAPLWLNYLSSALLYGAVGWLTNVLAIWMIFHPYEEKRIAALKIPFTPGVVAKNRNRFADSMGKFVEKELLKADSAAEIIEKNRSQIKATILEYFEQNDYQQFFELLAANSDFLAAEVLAKIEELILKLEPKDLAELKAPFNQQLNKYLDQKLPGINFAEMISSYLADNELDFSGVQDQLISKLDLQKITAAAAGEYNFTLNSVQLKNLLQNKELYPFLKFILPELLDTEIDYDLKGKLIEVLEADSDYYLDQGLNFIDQQQEKIAQLINFKKDEIIEAEKEKKGGLLKNTMISGAIYMADLDEFVDSVTARVFKSLKTEYFVEKRSKLENLYFKLLAEMNESDFLSSEKVDLSQLLSNFFASTQGADLLTEVLYLSETEINELLEAGLKAEKEDLFSFDLEIEADKIEYFINQHLKLEQKLQLLLKLKNLLAEDLIEGELAQLLSEVELKDVNSELSQLIKNSDLISTELIDEQQLKEILKNISELIKEPELNQLISAQAAADITAGADLLAEKMDRESLEYLLELFIESGVDSFKANSESLLKSLELKKLTAEEISKMNPAEIEEVFDSFAGRYFAQLKQYGWFGGIFGLLQLLIRTLI